MPKPLSRNQLEIARFPSPPDPAVAANAANRIRSTLSGNACGTRNPTVVSHQAAAGTNSTLATIRNVKMNTIIAHDIRSKTRSIDLPDINRPTEKRITATAIPPSIVASVFSGSRPKYAANNTAAEPAASAGVASCAVPIKM